MFRFLGKNKADDAITEMTVCLIGCGPAGMHFLHAIAERKAKGLAVPQVTCFERAESPGGIWRDLPDDDKDRTKPENATAMYEDMWCNTPKELMEYYDYTFSTHFNRPTPAYLPRKDILEYIIARNSTNSALDSVNFQHDITSVQYSNETSKFTIEATDRTTDTTNTITTDKCIWAGGIHAIPYRPDDVLELLENYTGKVIHSAEAVEGFEEDVKGKRVLIVGDARSAEDLALRAVKLGVEHVYCCARSGDGQASFTNAWPQDKVTVIYGPPYKVLKGNGFRCQGVYWCDKRQKYRRDDEQDAVKVNNIDTVVLCTGYDASLSFLPYELQFEVEGEWTISKGWKMENNLLTESIGTPEPSSTLSLGSTCYPDVYRGCLITNPNMMFIHETEDTISPIIETDVLAKLLVGYLTGLVPIPKAKDMRKANQKQLEAEMQVPWLRVEMDSSYGGLLEELPDDHWSLDPNDERGMKLDRSRVEFMVKRLARDATVCQYPVNFGNFDELSETGNKIVMMAYAGIGARTSLTTTATDTFRDNNLKEFVSIHNSESAVALPAPWIHLKAPEGSSTKLDTITDQS